MIDKIIEFIKEYLDNVDKNVEKAGKYKTISYALNFLIKEQLFSKDDLRKQLSIYTKRIISENEFEQILDYHQAEYAKLLYE